MKTLLVSLLSLFFVSLSHAQIAIYMRLIDNLDKNIYVGTGKSFFVAADPNTIPPANFKHDDEVALTTFIDGEEQTLNIGSQSTGAGAGKITFNPLSFSKTPDIHSPLFFQMEAAGAQFKWVEVSFYRTTGPAEILTHKIRYSLVAIKTIQRVSASCAGSCPEIVENFTMEQAAKYITYYPQNSNGSSAKGVGDGWNRVRNVRWDGTTAVN